MFSLLYFSTSEHGSSQSFLRYTPSNPWEKRMNEGKLRERERVRMGGFDLQVVSIFRQSSSSHLCLSICPATFHHNVVRQFHRRQNTMWKRIYYIYQNYKLYNCTTTVQIAQMCTCASLSYRYYVPVTLFFFFFWCFFILLLLLFVKRNNTKQKRLYIMIIDLFFSPPVLQLMEMRQLHILLSIFPRLCFLSREHWRVQEVWRYRQVSWNPETPLCK